MSGAPWKANEIEYQKNAGPIGVKVVDPLKVQAKEYVIKFIEPSSDDVTENSLGFLSLPMIMDKRIQFRQYQQLVC
jgi:hypothetical protein